MSDVGKIIAADKNAKAAISVTKSLRDEKIPELEKKIQGLESKCSLQGTQIQELISSVNLLKAMLSLKK